MQTDKAIILTVMESVVIFVVLCEISLLAEVWQLLWHTG